MVDRAAAGDGAHHRAGALLVDQGTSGAAEVFAAALDGNDRADLVGEHTLGRAARQRLVKLPDGSGLLLSNLRYLTPVERAAIHEKGLQPDVEVEQPEVEFGTEPPAADATLERHSSRASPRKAADVGRARTASHHVRSRSESRDARGSTTAQHAA